jgi:hypothetical protein
VGAKVLEELNVLQQRPGSILPAHLISVDASVAFHRKPPVAVEHQKIQCLSHLFDRRFSGINR